MKKSEVFNEGYQKGLRTVMRILKEQIEPLDYSKISEIHSWIDDLTLPTSSKKQAEAQNSGEFEDDESFREWLNNLGEPYAYGHYELFDSDSKEPQEKGLLNAEIVDSNSEGETLYDVQQDCLYIAFRDGGLYQVDEFLHHWTESEVDYNGNRTFHNIELFNENEGVTLKIKKLEFILK